MQEMKISLKVRRCFQKKCLNRKHGANVFDMHPTDEFICSECGIVIRDLCRYEYDEDTEDESCFEFVVKYCPNCGALIKEE